MTTMMPGPSRAAAPELSFEALLQRIRAEYEEMPGLNLTTPQACRLWNLDERTCQDALSALVAHQFLKRTPAGRYVRPDSGAEP
jgi:hypothetical protein